MKKRMKILIGVDGSDYSRAAIEKCMEFAGEADHFEIRLLTVAEPVVAMAEPWAVSASYLVEANQIARERANACVAKANADLAAEYPELARHITKAVGTGSPGSAIVEDADRWGADLIVVGSHGYGLLKRALLGSVSNSVVNHATCSVLVVRSEGTTQPHW